jgi:hypothetical protein
MASRRFSRFERQPNPNTGQFENQGDEHDHDPLQPEI